MLTLSRGGAFDPVQLGPGPGDTHLHAMPPDQASPSTTGRFWTSPAHGPATGEPGVAITDHQDHRAGRHEGASNPKVARSSAVRAVTMAGVGDLRR
jgi:hypothetical protein